MHPTASGAALTCPAPDLRLADSRHAGWREAEAAHPAQPRLWQARRAAEHPAERNAALRCGAQVVLSGRKAGRPSRARVLTVPPDDVTVSDDRGARYRDLRVRLVSASSRAAN